MFSFESPKFQNPSKLKFITAKCQLCNSTAFHERRQHSLHFKMPPPWSCCQQTQQTANRHSRSLDCFCFGLETMTVSCVFLPDQGLLKVENTHRLCLFSLHAKESEATLVLQQSVFPLKTCILIAAFIVIHINKKGNKAVECCHIIAWYDSLVTTDIDALYITYISYISSVIRDLPVGR